MDCEKCQELLSDFLDGTLKGGVRTSLSAHLEGCAACSVVRDELELIVGAARASREDFYAPPDSRAMWLRISNVIEGERALRPAAAAATAAPPRASVWERLFRRRWELTLPQMASAVAAIAVSVAFITAVGVQGLMDVRTARTQATQAPARTGMAEDGNYPHAFLRQQQTRISYLQQRVDQRKATWNPRMRDSFDRSLGVIDQAVLDSLDELKRNPHDEVSEEMLNSALRDKMELLREFCEQ
jgi:Putative zinc-finger